MALINPECIEEPEVCSRSDAPTSGQTRHNYSQSTESEKAKFQTPSTSNEARNYVERNSVEKISHDLVHLTKSDTASASIFSESEEREEITADVPAPADIPAPAPAPTLETIEGQSHTPGSRKSTRKNFGRPASAFSDFYMVNGHKRHYCNLDQWITNLKS